MVLGRYLIHKAPAQDRMSFIPYLAVLGKYKRFKGRGNEIQADGTALVPFECNLLPLDPRHRPYRILWLTHVAAAESRAGRCMKDYTCK